MYGIPFRNLRNVCDFTLKEMLLANTLIPMSCLSVGKILLERTEIVYVKNN